MHVLLVQDLVLRLSLVEQTAEGECQCRLRHWPRVVILRVLICRLKQMLVGRLDRVEVLHGRDNGHALEWLLFFACFRQDILMNLEHVADGLAFQINFLGVLV